MKRSMPSAALRVVALGGGAGLPSVMRGIAEAWFPRGWLWVPSDDHDRPSSVRFGGNLGSLTLTSLSGNVLHSILWKNLNDLRRDSHWAVERVGNPSAREAIAAADLIVLGPGSVYTNVLPVLLALGIAGEIGRSRARVALVMNLMTEPGGMDGDVASDCVRAIRRHAPEVSIHDVLLNDAPIRSDLVVSCAQMGALPIGCDTAALEALGCRPLRCDLLWSGPEVRLDPRKMGRALLGLAADVETWARDRPRVWAAQSATEAFD
jgi:hypothetical protein